MYKKEAVAFGGSVATLSVADLRLFLETEHKISADNDTMKRLHRDVLQTVKCGLVDEVSKLMEEGEQFDYGSFCKLLKSSSWGGDKKRLFQKITSMMQWKEEQGKLFSSKEPRPCNSCTSTKSLLELNLHQDEFPFWSKV